MFAALKGSQFYFYFLCLLAVFVIELKSDTEELLRSLYEWQSYINKYELGCQTSIAIIVSKIGKTINKSFYRLLPSDIVVYK